MLRLLYNLALLLLTIVSLPKWLLEMIRHRKHRLSFLQKLGLQTPTISISSTGPRIWIHSISYGETKAVAPLLTLLRQQMPHASFVISTVTETGQTEAKKSFPNADAYFYFPLDFSWVIKRLMKKIKPDLLIIVEGDFWFNLIDLAPRVALVNGKISEKSVSRFKKVPFFSRRLFQKIDLLCVQSERFIARFTALGVNPSRIVVTGNLKFDQPFPTIDKNKWRHDLGISPTDRVITLGSTHDPEEDLLLTALLPLMTHFPTLKFLIAPRHPERFPSIANLLEKKGIAFSRYSSREPSPHRIILIDTLGILSVCYQLSELAIVGGSFVSHVGGHNIFEPAAVGTPVLFGPYMSSQKDLVELVTHAGAGKQVTLETLSPTVSQLLSSPSKSMHEAGLRLAAEVQGSVNRTWEAIEKLLRQSQILSH